MININNSNISSNIKNQLLTLHNEVREKNKAPPLVWNNDLANGTYRWLNYLKNNEGCNMRHPINSVTERNTYLNNGEWGQNLAFFQGTEGSPNDCFKGWVDDECPKYNPANPADKSKGHTGHYTQIVWKDTKEVGCAKISCDGNKTLWGCNYNPAGNVYLGNDKFKLFHENVEKNC